MPHSAQNFPGTTRAPHWVQFTWPSEPTLGVTIATAGTGLAFGLVARSQEKALREGYDATADLYQGTRAQALDQNRNAVIADVAFGVAGAALIGTVISGIVGAKSASVQVTPAVSSTAAGISFGGTF